MEALVLSVKRSVFRRDDPEADHANAAFKKVRLGVLKRDNYSCGYCQFADDKFSEVHHRDDDHANNEESNLLTVCPLCHSCKHLGFASHAKRGSLIWLDPGVGATQADISALVRTLWVAQTKGAAQIVKHAKLMEERLHRCSIEMTKRFKSADPMVLAEYLLSVDDEAYAARQSWLQGIYLLPRREAFEKYIPSWSERMTRATPVDRWVDIARQKVDVWQQVTQG